MYRVYNTGDLIWFRQHGSEQVVYKVITGDGMYWSEYDGSLRTMNTVEKFVWKAAIYCIRGINYLLK